MMKFIRYLFRNFYFSFKDISKNIFRQLLSSFGIIFLISFLVLYLSLRQAVKDYIGGNLFGSLQINEFIVSPVSAESTELFEISAKPVSIEPAKVKKIGQIKNISEIHSVIRLDYPAKLKFDMLNRSIREFLPVFGVTKVFLKNSDKRWHDFNYVKEVPIMVPKFVLDVFNNLAAARGLPQFNEKVLIGFPLELNIQTTPRGAPERKTYPVQAKMFGFNADLPFSGLVVPSDFIIKFCNEHRADNKDKMLGYSYIKLFVSVKNVKELPEITKKIQGMGLRVESQQDVASKTNKALSIMDSSSFIIVGIFIFLTVIAIFNSYLTVVYNRSYKFSLQRIVGVSKLRIIMSFVLEAGIIGALLGIIGYYIGLGLIDYLSLNIARWVPVLKGLTFKSGQENMLLLSIGLSAVLSSISAFLPAVFASNINLFRSLQR